MDNLNVIINKIRGRLNFHRTRHQYGGADVISLAGLTVASEDISFTLNEYTSAQTLTANNFLVLVDASSGNVIVTLPAAASHTNRIYTIKKIDSSSNKVTVDANGTETIDDELTVALNLQYAYVTIVCDGDEWFITGGMNVKLEDLMSDQLDKQEEQIELLKKIQLETGQGKLHLEKMSGEKITPEDVR